MNRSQEVRWNHRMGDLIAGAWLLSGDSDTIPWNHLHWMDGVFHEMVVEDRAVGTEDWLLPDWFDDGAKFSRCGRFINLDDAIMTLVQGCVTEWTPSGHRIVVGREFADVELLGRSRVELGKASVIGLRMRAAAAAERHEIRRLHVQRKCHS